MVRKIARFYHANPKIRAQQLPAVLKLRDLLNEERDLTELDLTQQETQQIKDIFDLFDINCGGTIEKEELYAAKFALGFQRNDEGAIKVETTDKSITLEEFIRIMKGEKSGSCQNEDLWFAFSILTQSGRLEQHLQGSPLQVPNINLNRNEMPTIKISALKVACQEFEMLLTEGELVYMMDEADYDGSGSVDIHKFMRILGRTPWF